MPPTSDPLKLFMEDIEKTQTLSGKYAKIQTYIVSLKEEKSKINDLVPISKQFLDHAIKTLEEEHHFVSEKIKNILNQTGIIDVDVLPEEMIRVFQNPSLNQNNTMSQANNTVPQAPQVPMQNQQGFGSISLGQQGFGSISLGQQGFGFQQRMPMVHPLGMQHQQGFQQQQQIILSQLQQPQKLKQNPLQQQQGLIVSQMMKPSQVFSPQDVEKRPL
ncbi:unnamed protein product [Eruca vesicaria subsp. sativa]|uniref:Uncharacterized protein n=1 Tax=Eruca vesicaria subsp. sativa TaxID=29727 RepID=A0ABC8KH97_ERUVS|nr:unnamed protein product [Eruca vesicaria subsp. sativa]